MPDCPFCQIVSGQAPAAFLYQDDQVMAFLDIAQSTRGHTLVIPRTHYADIFSLPKDLGTHLFAVAMELAPWFQKRLGADGLNLIQSNGRAANQTVFHFHLHLVPRYAPTDFPLRWPNHSSAYSRSDLEALARLLRGDSSS